MINSIKTKIANLILSSKISISRCVNSLKFLTIAGLMVLVTNFNVVADAFTHIFGWFEKPVSTTTAINDGINIQSNQGAAANGGAIAINGNNNTVNQFSLPKGTKLVNASEDDVKMLENYKLKEEVAKLKELLNDPKIVAIALTNPLNNQAREALLSGDLQKVLKITEESIKQHKPQKLVLAQMHFFRAKAFDILKQYKEALNEYESAYNLVNWRNGKVDKDNWGYAQNYATSLSENNQQATARTVYKNVLEYLNVESQKDKSYMQHIALTFNTIAVFEYKGGDKDSAEKYYLKSLELYRELAKENPKQFNEKLSSSLINYALLQQDLRRTLPAENCFSEALKINRKLAKENPAKFNLNLAITLVNFARFYYANPALDSKSIRKSYVDEAIKIVSTNNDKNDPNAREVINLAKRLLLLNK